MRSLFHWLGRNRSHQGAASPVLRFAHELQGDPAPEQDRPSVDGAPPPLDFTPWTIARLQAISQEVLERPSQASLRAAQSARHCLSRFWLSAPVDALETYFAGPIGAVYRQLLSGALPALPLEPAEALWQRQLADVLQQGLDHHGSINVLLALLPYLDREAMQLHDPLAYVPAWLVPLYSERCDPALGSQPREALRQLPPVSAPPSAALAPLPELAPITGDAGMALIGDADFQSRLNGLINLYGLEPSDAEICSDLSRGRRQLAQIWLDVETEQLESLYRTPFGQLTDNLIRSDFAREPLSQDERAVRQQLAEVAADLRHPRALNALIAALLYYPIEQVSLPADPVLLPPWLSESLRQHGAQPATSD